MHASKDGRSVQVEIRFWLDGDGVIHVTSQERPDFHVRVKADPLKRNGHPSLYRRLGWLLKDAGVAAPN
jgi:hypothetical protein